MVLHIRKKCYTFYRATRLGLKQNGKSRCMTSSNVNDVSHVMVQWL